MAYEWIDEFLLGKPGVSKDLQESWNWIRYLLGDRMFAAICLDERNVPYYITCKLLPEEGALLREQYEDIVPGFYMNKQHWNSIRPTGTVPDGMVRHMLEESYRLVLAGLSKKKQRELLGEEA